MNIRIERVIFQRLVQHACQAYPFESCGLLSGPKNEADRVTRFFPCENAYDLERVSNERSSADSFLISSKQLMQIHSLCEAAGERIKIIYHSHVDVPADFSVQDRKYALWEGEPAYPQACYLVVSIRNRTFEEARLFAWDSDVLNFSEITWDLGN